MFDIFGARRHATAMEILALSSEFADRSLTASARCSELTDNTSNSIETVFEINRLAATASAYAEAAADLQKLAERS